MSKLNRFIKTNKGFTLVEVILTIAILGIVTPMILSMITDIYSTVIPNTQRMHAKEGAQLNLSRISRHIRNTDADILEDKFNTQDKINFKDQNEINLDGITIKYNSSNSQIKINGNQLNNIENLVIEKINSNIYEIKLEFKKNPEKKCSDNNCETIKTIVMPR